MLRIKPSEADTTVQAFYMPNLVLLPPHLEQAAPLVVFLPGTAGRPDNVRLLLSTVAAQGFKVVGLAYNDEPAVVQICPKDPRPGCSEAFRQQRVFGDAVQAPVTNPVQETIVRRLVMLLRHLDRQQPGAGWGGHLDGDEPRWATIVVAGLSQGAGMAAYIAKQRAVAGVVLFSSPWDFHGPRRTLAPWLAVPGVTPPQRWFAALHRRENTAVLITQAYAALQIPAGHIRVFDLDVPGRDGGSDGGRDNPFHGSTVRLPAYAPEWQWLFDQAGHAR